MGILIKGKEIKTPDFTNLSLIEARQKAYEKNIKLNEMLLNSEMAEPEVIISQYPQPGSLIKESGNRTIKVYYTPKKSEIIMPDLSGLSISECKNVLDDNNLKWYFAYVYSDIAPIDYVISQTYIAGSKIKKGNRVGVLISRGRLGVSFVMPEVIGKSADYVIGVFEEKGIKISSISYSTYEGLAPGVIINQSPRQGYKINKRSIIKLEVSE
jgi:serine/threonine-protein kinase